MAESEIRQWFKQNGWQLVWLPEYVVARRLTEDDGNYQVAGHYIALDKAQSEDANLERLREHLLEVDRR